MSRLLDPRFIKFGLVGISGIVIDFSVTWWCKEKWQLNKYISNSAGFCCALASNFILNRYWTFEQTGRLFVTQFATFALISITGLIINNLLLYLLSKYIKANFYLIKLAVIGLVFFWNYFMNFLFTFN